MESKVWLITGASRGIGKAIAEEAMQAGHRVMAGVRNPATSQLSSDDWPAEQLVVQTLDVNQESDIKAAVAACLDRFGRIDVLVNNAGYGLQGTVEEVTMEQVRQQMETNFFGLVALTQAVLPGMRAQQDGYIFNISSVAGLIGTPALGLYNASKFAVNGLTEALHQEVAPVGIKVSCVEPGPYRTDWAGASLKRAEALAGMDHNSPYQAINEKAKLAFDKSVGNQKGDPIQIAKVLVDAARQPSLPKHMLFGDQGIGWWEGQKRHMGEETYMRYYPYDKTTF